MPQKIKKILSIFFKDIYVDFVVLACLAVYVFTDFENTVFYWLCLAFTVLSVVLWLISRIQLGRAFSVAPQATKLVTSGIYSKIRNPMYVFSFCALLGIVMYTGLEIGYVFLLILIVIQVKRIHLEEHTLLNKFGEEYAQYKRNTWF